MDTHKYIDGLFLNYEETPALIDFKEELKSNLDDKIANLIKKGMSPNSAFKKATEELGDISALADEISLKKKKEVFSEMYMKTRNYMDTKRVALYVLCGVFFCFGILASALAYFFTPEIQVAPLGTLLIFSGISILGFVFLGLTQETASREAMTWKRAILYVIVCGVFLFGIFTFVATYFSSQYYPEGTAIATLIPFVLPSLAAGVFLVLTEKDWRKTWVKELADEQMKNLSKYAHSETFGLICGAIWISAFAVFALLTIRTGLYYSWLAFPAALVLQLLVQAIFASRSEKQ